MLKNSFYLSVLAVGALLTLLLSLPTYASEDNATDNTCPQWMNHDLKQLHSTKTFNLCEVTKGRPTLLINTASYCGYTKQFSQLESLYQKYKQQGLMIVGFPSNSFQQAAKTEKDAARVCYKNYGVSFYMSQTIDVTGPTSHAIFQHLAGEAEAPNWNFNKYLIDRDGTVIRHYDSHVKPMNSQLEKDITSIF